MEIFNPSLWFRPQTLLFSLALSTLLSTLELNHTGFLNTERRRFPSLSFPALALELDILWAVPIQTQITISRGPFIIFFFFL